MKNISLKKKLFILFIAIFFFSIHLSTTAYVNSSLIESWGVSNSIMSMVYTISSIITIIGLLYIPRINKIMTRRKLTLFFIISIILCVIGLLYIKDIFLLLSIMIIFLSIRSFVVFQNDILLEHVSEEKYIGRIRGALIVLASTAWGFGPLVSGYFIDYFSIEVVYWLGLVAALVPLFIFFFFFKKEENKKQNIHSIKKMYQELFKDRNLLYVFFISLGINIFYALSIIYIPLHLHSFIGFDWSEIGGLLLISQIPFIFFAYPIGKIADSYIGEQEIIITGVLISILSLIGMIFTKSSNFVAWALLLFISRVGMSFLDTGCETYFFKKIKKDDSEKIAVQRNTFPLSYLLISGIGIIIGIFTESYVPFFVIGIISFIIILYPAFKIEDTL